MDSLSGMDRNEKRRKAYAAMDADKKTELLKKRRVRYALKNRVPHTSESECEAGSNFVADQGLSLVTDIGTTPSTANTELNNAVFYNANVPPETHLAQHTLARRGNALCKVAHIQHEFYPATRLRTGFISTGFPDLLPVPHVQSYSTLLPSAPNCTYCNAKRFYHESKGFCCSEGEVSIASPTMPPALAQLFTDSDIQSSTFRKYVRSYNNNLAFTTFAAKKDNELMKNKLGVYTFKVQGKIHHYLPSFNAKNDTPIGVQFYFYDPQSELEERLATSSRFSRDVMIRLMHILAENPYVHFLRQVRDLGCVHEYRLCLVSNPRLDQRIYNEPTCDDVSAILSMDEEDSSNLACHIQIYSKDAMPYRVCHNYGCYDPLQYPLIFPRGQVGWHCNIEKLAPNNRKRGYRCYDSLDSRGIVPCEADQLLHEEKLALENGLRKRNTVSCRQYYCYKLQIRDNDSSMLLHTGRLLQQFIVDMFVKVETSRLEYIYKQQKEIRTECLQGILDSIAGGNNSSAAIGRKVVLPPSFVGGPRDMKKRYMDAMCLVQNFGKPDFFLTMTCNSSWPEISNHLLPHELPQNRPDLVARVFKAKLEMLKKELLKDHIFGIPVACVYSIEFQKRGLPHAHLLLIMDKDSKPLNPEAYDRFISAELPDPLLNPHLHDLVLKHMVHGPCGLLNPNCPCMRDKKCKNKYPKEFLQYTTHGSNSYPHYKRRNTGISSRIRGHVIDNRWIVPYNPYLLQKYDCHINVEICSTIKLVKYIYKYIYKGPDKISFQMGTMNVEDEVKEYQEGRWVGPPEAAWRLYAFDLFEMQPAVVVLQLHLPDNYLVSFGTDQDLNNIVSNDFQGKTMLMQFFHMNRTNDRVAALSILYKDFPKYFVWNSSKRIWSDRRRGKVVGRIVSADPREGERYYLRLLLNHVPSPKSYNDLLTVNGYLQCTFRAAALARNLLATDADLEMCLDEAILYQMPNQLRHLFASILVHCVPSDPIRLWQKYAEPLFEDYTRTHSSLSLHISEIHAKALQHLSVLLNEMGKELSDYSLQQEASAISFTSYVSKDMDYEMNIAVDDNDLLNVHRLNVEQRRAYDSIMGKIVQNEPCAFFIDGPGGTGKTYLYKAILATLRSQRHIALATATSGVAACALPGGRTAHSRFKLPFHDENNQIASVSKQSTTAKLLRESKVIIWDEAPMAHRQSVEAFSEMLKDITEVNQPFGNKVVVFGGDFRQVLPVVTNSTKQQQLDASLFSSPLWPTFTKLSLTENIRAKVDPYFTDFLLRIGDGTEPEDENGNISLPINMVIPFSNKEASLQQLINFVYPDINVFATNNSEAMSRALLAPTNDCVDDINETMLNNMPGLPRKYISNDMAIHPQHRGDYDDFLNSLHPSSLPPHELVLKPNSPVILLRNLNPVEGLCNGTRLICKQLQPHTIVAEIVTGPHTGNITILHKIPLQSSNEDKCAIPFKRYQFPIRLCFAMTINKAQGQTLDRVGVYLREPVFSHGQLYVALSRAKESNSVKVLIAPPTFTDNTNSTITRNVVYREIHNRVQNNLQLHGQ